MVLAAMAGIVFISGCVGGFINGWKADYWGLRYKNPKCDTWFPGVLGYVLAGGFAAIVFWGLYGPLRATPVLSDTISNTSIGLSLSEVAGSILIGLGGYSWLSSQATRKCAENQLKNK